MGSLLIYWILLFSIFQYYSTNNCMCLLLLEHVPYLCLLNLTILYIFQYTFTNNCIYGSVIVWICVLPGVSGQIKSPLIQRMGKANDILLNKLYMGLLLNFTVLYLSITLPPKENVLQEMLLINTLLYKIIL